MSHDAHMGVEQELVAVVTRCGCGNPTSHIPNPCPTPSSVENLGVVSYWHRNPAIRLAKGTFYKLLGAYRRHKFKETNNG